MAEKSESLLFLVIGILAIQVALGFFLLKTSFFKGAAFPFLVIGLIQCIVGYTVYARSDEDRIRNVYAYDMDPSHFQNTELPRMQKVNRNFVIYRWAEIALTLTGLVLIIYHRSNAGSSFWYGLGIALTIQSSFMLGADLLAEKRAARYTAAIREWLKK